MGRGSKLLTLVLLPTMACGTNGDAPHPGPTDPEPVQVTRTLDVGGTSVHLIEAGPRAETGVLLLHGGRFSSATWEELGTIEVVADAGFHVVAVDLPGFGRSGPWEGPREAFLGPLLDELGLERVLVVSPSMSGCFSLPFVAAHSHRVAGYLPVSPACMEGFEGPVEVPALVVWGADDQSFPPEMAPSLAAHFPGAEIVILPNARHPCYLDQPEHFHELLIDFAARTLDG